MQISDSARTSVRIPFRERILACAAGGCCGLGTALLVGELAVRRDASHVRALLDAGAPLSAADAAVAHRLVALDAALTPFAAMPRWAVALAVLAAVALACVLAARTIRRGSRARWAAASFAAPLALSIALWHGALWVRGDAPVGFAAPGTASPTDVRERAGP